MGTNGMLMYIFCRSHQVWRDSRDMLPMHALTIPKLNYC